MPKVTPFLWFNNDAQDAFAFYNKLFTHSKIIPTQNGPDGKFFTGTIEIEGQILHAMNGGPHYKLNPAFSLVINCANQEEVDYYWNALIADGGEESRCGWCVDKFGVSWQVIPHLLFELINNKNRAGAGRAMQAMLQMNKIECGLLQKAFDGE